MKRKLNNTELESIGKAIFKSEPLPAAEIDRIVSKSELFSLVQRRIQNTPAAAAPVQVRALPHRRYVLAWSGMALTFAAAGALAVVNLSTKEAPKKAPAQIAVLNQVPEIAVPDTVAGLEVPPQPNTGKLSASPATKIERDVPRYEHAIVRTPATRRREEPVNAAPEKFYPVSYTGDPMETAVGGQVIRVEMKRSSLFALGVDLPLENDDAVVKADLLVGRDGVTRAVRLVDQ
jgi:hypothetical protein